MPVVYYFYSLFASRIQIYRQCLSRNETEYLQLQLEALQDAKKRCKISVVYPCDKRHIDKREEEQGNTADNFSYSKMEDELVFHKSAAILPL